MKTINLKDIIKELFIEEGFSEGQDINGTDIFSTYYGTKKNQFGKILDIVGIDKKVFKIGKDYAINPEDKELVKILLQQVETTYAKGLRLNNHKKYTKYDRFEFLLNIENELEKRFQGVELIRQKEKFYGYSRVVSEYKVYEIKKIINDFMLEEFKNLQVSEVDINAIKNEVDDEELIMKAYEEGDLETIQSLYNKGKNISFYNITENDRILILGLYKKVVKDILGELKIFTEKFADCREFFDGKTAIEVFKESINDYNELVEEKGEQVPEECVLAVKELLRSKGRI